MRKIFALMIMVFTVFSVNNVFAAEQYKIDPTHSTIGFAVTHMEVSIVRGEFTEYDGEISFDEKESNNLQGTITI